MSASASPLSERYAEFAYASLLGTLERVRHTTFQKIHEAIGLDHEMHLQVMRQEPALQKAANFINGVTVWADAEAITLEDPGLLHELSTFLNIMVEIYERKDASAGFLTLLSQSRDALFREFLQSVRPQADDLCRLLMDIARFLRPMAENGATFVLLELPVGNTIPTRLLESALENIGLAYRSIRVSLGRNEKPKQGLTRDALLSSTLQTATLTENDILVYVDEWNTGVNFDKISAIISSSMNGKHFFLPCAFLKPDAHEAPRFQHLCQKHDLLLNKVAATGMNFRRKMPPLGTRLQGFAPFFWAENDRIAGVRKLQLHGALFSTIDATIKQLSENEDLQIEALRLFQERSHHAAANLEPQKMISLFAQSYAAYEERREEFALAQKTKRVAESFLATATLSTRCWQASSKLMGETKYSPSRSLPPINSGQGTLIPQTGTIFRRMHRFSCRYQGINSGSMN